MEWKVLVVLVVAASLIEAIPRPQDEEDLGKYYWSIGLWWQLPSLRLSLCSQDKVKFYWSTRW